MYREAWSAGIHGVAKSRTRLSNWTELNWVQSRCWESPWRMKCLPTPVFSPGEFHGQRSLTGYSPWGSKESDMTERLSQFDYKSKTTMNWGGGREEGSGWGTHVYLWRIHFNIWQNQYNIVKFKNKIKFKKNLLWLIQCKRLIVGIRVSMTVGGLWNTLPVTGPDAKMVLDQHIL